MLEADAAGVVERVRVGSRLLEVGELARCWHDGRWVDTVVRWTGDGNRPLPAPVLVPVVLSEVVRGRPQATGYAPGPAIPVESGTSLRLIADDDLISPVPARSAAQSAWLTCKSRPSQAG